MGARGFITIVLVLFLAFLSNIFIVFGLHGKAFYLEFILLCILGITALMVLFGAYFDEMWTWQLSSCISVVMIANFIALRLRTANIGLVWLGVIVSLIGFFASITSLKSYEEYVGELGEKEPKAAKEPVLETYKSKEPKEKPAKRAGKKVKK